MRRSDHAELVDLAASVADGAPIDWSQAEARTDGASRRLVGHLRLVERIATLHRSIPEDRGVTEVAAAVADREAIDWDAIEAGLLGKDRRLLRQLRLVENISTLHRTMALEERTVEAERLIEVERDAPAPLDSEQPAGPRWGQLVLLDSIGQGASSEVFRAWDSTLHQEVALKLLHDDGASADTHGRLLDEARRLARVRHRHVVHVYGADEHDGRVGLWMELVRGNSLEEIVKTRGSFGEREAALIGLDLCTALAAVHRAGLLHRDIKAQNVMREDGGRIVLMDFGTGEELAGTNRLVGTPLYLAPEIFRGEKASARTDIYSAGVLLYYLVTGQFPVTAASMADLARAHAGGQRRPLRDLRPDLHESFVRVIERSLDSDPKRRYASAGELEAGLRETIAPQAQTFTPQPLVAEIPAPARVAQRPRTGLAFAAAAVVLVAVLGAVGLIVWTRVPPPAALELASVRRVAVLPMTDSSGGQLPTHFAAALTDELVTTLGQIRALTVKTVPANRASGRSTTDLARDLDVDALLVASLSASAPGTASPRVRVNVQLLAARTGEVLWPTVFERARGETLSLQADIAKAIAGALRVALTPEENKQIARVRPTNPAAEEAYLLGKIHLNRYGMGSAELARRAFERAIALDPNYAAAHAGAAWAQVTLGANGAIPSAQARANALQAVRRALQIDPELGDAHATLGYIYFLYEWDWNAAEASLVHSIELNPSSNHAHTLYLNYLSVMGRFDEAVEQARISKRLEPESGPAARLLVLANYYKRDYAAAENALAQARVLEPNAAANAVLQARVDEALGRQVRAYEALQRAQELSAGGSVALRVAQIRHEALLGQREDAQRDWRALKAELQGRNVPPSSRDDAYVQLALGNVDAAIDSFTQAVEDRDINVVWLGIDPRVDPLRGNVRFQQLLSRVGLPIIP